MLRSIVASICVLMFGAVGWGAQDTDQEVQRFKLFNECQGMYLALEDLSEHADRIGLTKEAMQDAIRNRLGSDDFFSPEPEVPYLYVVVNVTPSAYSIRLEYNKWVYDPASDSSAAATTWLRGVAGSHGDDASYIISTLERQSSIFFLEYLRENYEHCQ